MCNSICIRFIDDKRQQCSIRSGSEHHPALSVTVSTTSFVAFVGKELRTTIQYFFSVLHCEAMRRKFFESDFVGPEAGDKRGHLVVLFA